MPSLQHTHSYVRYRKGKKIYYKCDHPQCTHFAERDLIAGKESLCPECHKTVFVLTYEDLKRAKPKCKNCSNTVEAQRYRAAKRVVGSVMDQLGLTDSNDKGDGHDEM
jgi:transposase-like protein